MHKKLTQQLVRARSKIDNISLIKKFNLCGNDLTDVSIMSRMTNLEVVSLSVNKIRTLEYFSNLNRMKLLYLRDNKISEINEIFHLQNCQALTTLWLIDNPCTCLLYTSDAADE